MSNHTHIVFYIDEDSAKTWSDEEVINRWLRLFTGTLLIQDFSKGKPIADYLQDTLSETIACYRQRLMDIS